MVSFFLDTALKDFQKLYIVILSNHSPLIIYCWVTGYPILSSLTQNKTKPLIFSQFLWVRNLSAL